ncbi:hypothetical protein [Brucella pituitosa]
MFIWFDRLNSEQTLRFGRKLSAAGIFAIPACFSPELPKYSLNKSLPLLT